MNIKLCDCRYLVARKDICVILARKLMDTLRNRELAQAAKDIADDTGLEHRPAAEGQRVGGIFQRAACLAFAWNDTASFTKLSAVPNRPVENRRIGYSAAGSSTFRKSSKARTAGASPLLVGRMITMWPVFG